MELQHISEWNLKLNETKSKKIIISLLKTLYIDYLRQLT